MGNDKPQRSHCFTTHLHKEDKVLEGGVEVGLLLQPHDRIEVLVVDVGIHTEQPLQDRLGH